MRTARIIAMAAATLTWAGGEIIDRVAVSLGDQVVTLGEIRRLLRVEAFSQNAKPDYSPENLKRAADLLVDQALVRREMELSRYSSPAMVEVDEAIQRFIERRHMTEEQFQAAVKEYGFTEDDFRQEILWRLTLTRFIDYRFRPGVQVSDDEISEYYEKTFLPQFRKTTPEATPPPLAEVRERISNILAVNKATAASNQWLQQAQQQTKIRYYKEAFQ
jgi:peptidyl-prolyl cis-trans isomerase SurA